MNITYATESAFNRLRYNELSATVDEISGDNFQTVHIKHIFAMSTWLDNRPHHESNAIFMAVPVGLSQTSLNCSW